MKKIIALLLCSASSCFGLNMPTALKPNPSTLSQSWNNLSFTSRAMIITASVVSLAGILCAAWPISEQSAHEQAEEELNLIGINIVDDHHDKTSEAIKELFKNPAIFYFGPFWNRKAFHVVVDTHPHENLQTQETKTILTLKLINTKTTQEKRFEYIPTTKKWQRVKFLDSNGKPSRQNLPDLK